MQVSLLEEAKDAKERIMPKGKTKMSSRRSSIVKPPKAIKKGAYKMTRKVIIPLIVLVFLLLVVIGLHVLSTFYSFTLFGLEEEQYKALVSDAIFLLAFVIALIPLFQVWQNTRKLRQELKEAQEQFQKEHGIQSFPIKQPGVDDLEWMLPHYQKASRLTIFAGSFDWLADKPEIEKRILELAGEGKLDLVSYRSKEQVAEAFRTKKNLQSLFKMLGDGHFKFKSKLKNVTCTFVQKPAMDTEFLYKSRPDDEGHMFNACVLSDTDKSRVLLHILSELTKAEHWGKRANEVGQSIEGSEGKG